MHIIIIGCGRVGSQLAQMLSQESHNVVIIDKDEAAFKRLGSDFNGITLKGVGFDLETLRQADIEKADAIAAVTNGDNSNIMIVQIAKKIFNVPRAIARIYDPLRANIYYQFGLETICSTTIGATMIRNMVLRENVTYRLTLGKETEIIEVRVEKEISGKKVSELNIAQEFMIAAIKREDEVIIPTPDTIVWRGDSLIGSAKTSGLKKLAKELYLKKEAKE